MVTVEDIVKRYYPGFVFGAAVGFLFSAFLKMLSFENDYLVKLISFDVKVYGLTFVLLFASFGVLLQYLKKWY